MPAVGRPWPSGDNDGDDDIESLCFQKPIAQVTAFCGRQSERLHLHVSTPRGKTGHVCNTVTVFLYFCPISYF